MRSYDEFCKIANEIDFEKEAATRWKKEYGNLSEDAQRTLKTHVAKSSRSIARGIEQGNSNLMKKYNIGFVPTDDKKKVSNYLSHNSNYSQYQINQFADKQHDVKPTSKILKLINKGRGDERRMPVIQGFNKKRQINNMDGYLEGLSKSERRAFSAVSLRHEIDEYISALKHGKAYDKNGNRFAYKGHNAPDVIHKESANIALLQDNVRDALKKARKDKEAHDLALYGVNYGKSPVMDHKKSNRHVADFQNKVLLGGGKIKKGI